MKVYELWNPIVTFGKSNQKYGKTDKLDLIFFHPNTELLVHLRRQSLLYNYKMFINS